MDPHESPSTASERDATSTGRRKKRSFMSRHAVGSGRVDRRRRRASDDEEEDDDRSDRGSNADMEMAAESKEGAAGEETEREIGRRGADGDVRNDDRVDVRVTSRNDLEPNVGDGDAEKRERKASNTLPSSRQTLTPPSQVPSTPPMRAKSSPSSSFGPPAENMRFVTAEIHHRPSLSDAGDDDDDGEVLRDEEGRGEDESGAREKAKAVSRNENEDEDVDEYSRTNLAPTVPSHGRSATGRSSRVPSEGTIGRLEGLRVDGDASIDYGKPDKPDDVSVEPSRLDRVDDDGRDPKDKKDRITTSRLSQSSQLPTLSKSTPLPPLSSDNINDASGSKRAIDQVSVSSTDDGGGGGKPASSASTPPGGHRKQRRHPIGLRRFRVSPEVSTPDATMTTTPSPAQISLLPLPAVADQEMQSSTEAEDDESPQQHQPPRRRSFRRRVSADRRNGGGGVGGGVEKGGREAVLSPESGRKDISPQNLSDEGVGEMRKENSSIFAAETNDSSTSENAMRSESDLVRTPPSGQKDNSVVKTSTPTDRRRRLSADSDSALPADEEMTTTTTTSFHSGPESSSGTEDGRKTSRSKKSGGDVARGDVTKLSPIRPSIDGAGTVPEKDVVTNNAGEVLSEDSASSSASRSRPRARLGVDDGNDVGSGRTASSSSSSPSAASFSAAAPGMPKLSTAEARGRNFLVRGVNSGKSLLGVEELERLLGANRKLSIFVATFNFNGSKTIPDRLDDVLLPMEGTEYMNDVYVVSTQEHTNSTQYDWDVKIQETLGPSFVLYHSSSHGVLHSAIFLRRDLIWFASLPLESKVTTRPVAQIKTKGALALSFSVFGSSFLFINSHMAANRSSQPDRLKERVQDYVKIASSLNFKKAEEIRRGGGGGGAGGNGKISKSKSGTSINNNNNAVEPLAHDDGAIVADNGGVGQCHCDVTEQFEFCLWMGDLNFRLRRRRDSVVRMLGDAEEEEEEEGEGRGVGNSSTSATTMTMELDTAPLSSGSTSNLSSTSSNRDNYDTLFLWDELRNEMTEGNVFRGFQEGKIQFRPSYKYDVGTKQTFDTSTKQRVPAYTDRILYRSKKKNQMACVAYDVCMNVTESDHKPVFGIFEARIRPGREHAGLACGQFHRQVYEEASKRRANHFLITEGGGKKKAAPAGNLDAAPGTSGNAIDSGPSVGKAEGGAPNSKVCAVM